MGSNPTSSAINTHAQSINGTSLTSRFIKKGEVFNSAFGNSQPTIGSSGGGGGASSSGPPSGPCSGPSGTIAGSGAPAPAP